MSSSTSPAAAEEELTCTAAPNSQTNLKRANAGRGDILEEKIEVLREENKGERERGWAAGRGVRRQKREGGGKNAFTQKISQTSAGEKIKLKTRVQTALKQAPEMLLLSRVCFLLLLHLCVMELICSTSVSPSQHHTRVRIIEVEDDYDDISSKTTLSPQSLGLTTSRVIRRPCEYDPCAVQTSPCDVISAQTGCLCPGLTGPQERPEPPELRELKLDPSGVEVHWCAPRSTVTHYEVTLKDENMKQTFGEYLRNCVIPELKFGQTVCVAAANDAGISEKSCARYEAPTADHAALSAGIIGGSISLLLLLVVLAVVLWRRRTCRKAGMGDAEGLGNPSYSNDGAL